MGGFVRSITRRIFKVIAPPAAQAQAPAAAIAEPEKKTVDTSMQEKAKLAGSGYGGSTIMTSAKGLEDDKILGGFLFTDYDGNNIYVHLAIESPRLFSRKHIRYVFDYGFKQIGCGRMTAVCRNGYKRNERILSGTGWTKEGVVRQVMKIDNNFVDAAIYGMLKQECKWI